MPEGHAQFCERHIAACVVMTTFRGYSWIVDGSRLAPVLLSGFTSQRAGVFSLQQPMPPGIKPPQHCASPEPFRLAADFTIVFCRQHPAIFLIA